MTDQFVPSLRDRALAARDSDLRAVEAQGHHERKHWIKVQKGRFAHELGQLGHPIIPEMVQFVEVGDGVHQELCHEVEGVHFRLPVDYQVHRALVATLVCTYCGQGCVTRRVDNLEDLGAAYEEMSEHEAWCLDGCMENAAEPAAVPASERHGDGNGGSAVMDTQEELR